MQYAKYVQLLFQYADKKILQNGSYDEQVAAFAQGKTAFLHQGNWVDPNLKQLGASFEMGYAPHAFLDAEEKGLYVFAPSFYCVNAKSPNAAAAKAFLASIAGTSEGHSYMVKSAGMIPAFKSVKLQPEGKLSRVLMAANARGGNYGVFFGMMPDGARARGRSPRAGAASRSQAPAAGPRRKPCGRPLGRGYGLRAMVRS